ncbi:hypothetical protein [Noviherbaspirillum sp.]|jgi:hypothetical protein|uniref:hypothetical protein n=1 Tax=Noviherbaspirillum sp. TaxID=1926288 RepID=UPI002600D450|nr:hypothetical protein [Noviherbaspirillum sp.]
MMNEERAACLSDSFDQARQAAVMHIGCMYSRWRNDTGVVLCDDDANQTPHVEDVFSALSGERQAMPALVPWSEKRRCRDALWA